MTKLFFIFLLSLLIQLKTDCHKILVFNQVFVPSHTNFMVNIANLLSKAGHNVTIIQSPMNPNIDDSNVKGPKIEKPAKRNPKIDENFEKFNSFNEDSWIRNDGNPLNIVYDMYQLSQLLADSCENIIMDTELTRKLKQENFDLGIAEIFSPCGLGVLKYYNIKNTITVFSGCSFDSHYESLGLPVPVSQLPTSIAPLPKEMNIFQRFMNLISFITLKKIHSDSVDIGNKMFERVYKEGQIDLEQLFRETAFYVDNCDPLLNLGSPTTPKFLHLGGFLNKNPKPLSSELDEILSKREKNVFISFGSFTKSSKMTHNMKNNLVRLFKEYPNVTFLWKYDADKPEVLNEVDNVFLSKWMPQNDLLADSRMSLFITHGGMNSFLEAAKFGVPLLDIPLFGDQPKNAKMAEELNLGRTVTKFELNDNFEKFRDIFNDVLNNKLYKESAKKMSLMIAQRPYDPKELFVKYTEFAAQFGRVEHFAIPGANMPYWKFFYLDVLLIFIGIIFLIILIIRMFIGKVKKFLCSNKKNHKID